MEAERTGVTSGEGQEVRGSLLLFLEVRPISVFISSTGDVAAMPSLADGEEASSSSSTSII